MTIINIRLVHDCESNHMIASVVVLIGFNLIGSKKWSVITLPIRNMHVIAIGCFL